MGGAPFNFAFHLHQCGHDVTFISRIGKDNNGKEIKGFMEQNSMNIDFLQRDPLHKTGEVHVCLDSHGMPSFTIKKDAAYDFIQPAGTQFISLLSRTHLFYFGTLAQRHPVSRKTLHTILDQLPGETLVFFDINLRQDFFSREIIEVSLSACDILKANDDELVRLKDMFHLPDNDYEAVLKLMTLFNISSLCITKGSKGASLYVNDKHYHVKEPSGAREKVIDTVGAGDGFAAALAIGMLSHLPPGEVMKTADTFARRLCSIKGALPAEYSFYHTLFPRFLGM
jgi:fructokinase